MAILIGMTVAQGKNMSMKSVWLSAAGLSVFLLGTVVAQSRFAIATCLLLFAYFLYFMLRTGRTKVFVTGIVAIGAVVLVGLVFVQQMDLAYVQATFEKKITNDSSFRARQLGIDNLMDQAIDLAPLGAGWDSRGYSIDRTGDNWAKTNSIDNGYMQAFINHGIPGVLHLAFLFWSLWWVIRLARRHEYLHIRTLRVIAGLLLATYLVYSLSGVRHAKLESSVYWMVITGLLYGCVYGEKHFGEKFWLRKRPQPQLAA
jgi:O-antigen ligase